MYAVSLMALSNKVVQSNVWSWTDMRIDWQHPREFRGKRRVPVPRQRIANKVKVVDESQARCQVCSNAVIRKLSRLAIPMVLLEML